MRCWRFGADASSSGNELVTEAPAISQYRRPAAGFKNLSEKLGINDDVIKLQVEDSDVTA